MTELGLRPRPPLQPTAEGTARTRLRGSGCTVGPVSQSNSHPCHAPGASRKVPPLSPGPTACVTPCGTSAETVSPERIAGPLITASRYLCPKQRGVFSSSPEDICLLYLL